MMRKVRTFFFSRRRRHARYWRDWSSDVCSSDLDDPCAAVVSRAGVVRSSIVSSQTDHERFGGVVPGIASRHHLELVNAVVDEALRSADAGWDDEIGRAHV